MSVASGRTGGRAAGIAGVVLAAGASSRLEGRSKLLLPYGGDTVVAASVRAALSAMLDPVMVVLGHRGPEVRRALRSVPAEGAYRLRFVTVTDPSPGQGVSLATGIASLARDPAVEAVAVLLGDEPGIRAADIRTVADAWRGAEEPVARARYRDRPGHPVVFGRSWFGRLAGLAGDAGAAELLARFAGEVLDVALPSAAPIDVDTRADHALATGRAGERPAGGRER